MSRATSGSSQGRAFPLALPSVSALGRWQGEVWPNCPECTRSYVRPRGAGCGRAGALRHINVPELPRMHTKLRLQVARSAPAVRTRCSAHTGSCVRCYVRPLTSPLPTCAISARTEQRAHWLLPSKLRSSACGKGFPYACRIAVVPTRHPGIEP